MHIYVNLLLKYFFSKNLVKEVLCADIEGALHGLRDNIDVHHDNVLDGDKGDVAKVEDKYLHLLLHVPQLLLVFLSFSLVGRLDK